MKYTFEDLQKLAPNEFREVIDTIRPRIYVWRYIWKNKDAGVDGNPPLHVKYISDVKKAHEDFRKFIRESEDIVSCIAEYIGEVDPVLMGFSDSVKTEVEIEKED